MSFAPVIASRNITEKYKRYLRTIFRIADRDYAEQFEKALADDASFCSGPYLDVNDSFVKGHAINQLVEEGLLSNAFRKLNMPIQRPLYKHQEIAIRQVLYRRNVVVSTGTGSGKTESFLIPIFNHLFRENEAGLLSAGVRALMIYPMNALANDQVGRLRDILANTPEITFGSYTGQTKHKFREALIEYQSLNEGRLPLPNELISREQITASPPHILITNYAMLEYLMVRPKDSVFFQADYADKWKFIVLDEAHTYHGSTGIEVSMLLRRLKARLQNDSIQYILTSATLGGPDDDSEVATFATNLCDSDFSPDNVVRAHRIILSPDRAVEALPRSFYRESAYISSNAISGSPSEVLFDTILHDQNYWDLRSYLQTPKTVSSLAALLGWQQSEVTDFVTVASRCEKNGERLLDARYHMFLRATESVFITLRPSGKLFLNRKDYHYEGDERYKVFEIAVCSACNVIYLVGEEQKGYLEQNSRMSSGEARSVFLLADAISDDDEDSSLSDSDIRYDEYRICAKCGHLRRASQVNGQYCEHGEGAYIRVFRIRIETPSGTLTKCLSCENTNSFGILRMFFAGQEAVTSVIGTALYEELPGHKVTRETSANPGDDDDTGFGYTPQSVQHSSTERVAKQFIAFSDSRQAAAFYSSYLDLTYRSILYRRLIVEALGAPKDKKNVPELISDLTFHFENNGVALDARGLAAKEAWKALLSELVDNNGTTSLFSMGILGISIDGTGISANPTQGLSKEDVTALCSVFALGLMADAALSYPANLTAADKEFFTHNGVENSYTMTDADAKQRRKSFLPIKGSNKRLDYIMRVMERKGQSISSDRALKFLEAIWQRILVAQGILVANQGSFRVDTSKVVLSSGEQWYRCNKCKKVTIHNVANVCPSFKCQGTLEPVSCEDSFGDNHYYNLYRNMDIREMKVVEHTAQLDKETAYEYQRMFQRKEIDVLSCSTTFEMGVDVGTLETVFMRNMPPSPANYAQRAGRAGRSRQSAAYAVTFCNRSSHDFTFFRHPENMIRGKIHPPKFKVENERIALRHVYAAALGHFWSQKPDYFAKTASMTEAGANGTRGFDEFKAYLEGHPSDLRSYLLRFLPSELQYRFAVDSFGWIDALIGVDGAFTKAVAEYDYEVGVLKDAMEQAWAKGQRVDGMRARLNVYQNEDVLAFLSRKNVLPKYGFPVDVVELSIFDRQGSGRLGLQLQRDLSLAISEYAPSSEVVANGHLVTSRYIRKIPNMTWKMFDYIMCPICKTLNIHPHVENTSEQPIPRCRQCHHGFEGVPTRTFLIPTFGFEADGDKIRKPGLKKPERTFRGETAYVGYREDISLTTYEIGNGEVQLAFSTSDELATVNEARFYLCDKCGFTDLDDECHVKTKRMKHHRSSGYPCPNETLRNYSLGYRFETDVVQMRLVGLDLSNWDRALSVLYGVLRGVCLHLAVEESDIAGCLRYYYNEQTTRADFALILFDSTPGGAGHVRRLNDASALDGVLRTTLRLMEQCDCGGEIGDASCYSCLRGYSNQKYHDNLKRRYVIEALQPLFT